MAEPFESPKFLIGQTHESLNEFRTIYGGLFQGQAYSNIVDIEPNTGNKIYKVRFNRPIPGRLRHIVSTAVSDLRHCLDQAMCDSLRMLRPSVDIGQLYFPFVTNPKDLKGRLASPPLNDFPQEILALLETFEPYPRGAGYPGGNDLLAAFSKITGPNKHQISCNIECRIPQIGVDSIRSRDLMEMSMPPRWDMANNELTIGKTFPSGHIDYNFQILFYVGLANAGELSGQNVDAVISSLLPIVENIVLKLEAKSGEIASAGHP